MLCVAAMRYHRVEQSWSINFLKLHTDSTSALNTITSYGDGYIEINQVRYSHAVAFGPEGPITEWPVGAAHAITTSHLRQAAGIPEVENNPLAFLDEGESAPVALPPGAPEVLLVGTGNRQHFLPMDVVGPLLQAGVGIESMDTKAAARTYNILMAEGRRVIVALIPTDGDPQS
jgi:uncharacterized protein